MRKPKQGQDLETLFPKIAAEWDYSKNDGYRPCDFSYGSNFPADWICPSGHSYTCRIRDRTTKQRGCPKCRQRFKTSFPEQALFFYVKKVFPDAVNRDREALGNGLELDVYVPSLHMAVEYDGSAWHKDDNMDRERIKYHLCKEKGIQLIRVKENRKHWKDSLGISDYIVRCLPRVKRYTYLSLAIETVLGIMGDIDYAEMFSVNHYFDLLPKLSTRVSDGRDSLLSSAPSMPGLFQIPANSPRVKTDVDVARDRTQIMEQYYSALGDRNLENVYPEIAKEWHPSKNGKLTPKMFPPYSGEKVWWLCPKGHPYPAVISERTRRNDGCPFCSGRYPIVGENDFATVHPELLNEWDWAENAKKGLDPHRLKPMSDAVACWICSKCGRKWTAPIKARSKGHGCWDCANPLRNRSAAKKVFVYDAKMNFLAEYCSIAEASKNTGVAKANICRACKHKYHALQKGLFFSYEMIAKD